MNNKKLDKFFNNIYPIHTNAVILEDGLPGPLGVTLHVVVSLALDGDDREGGGGRPVAVRATQIDLLANAGHLARRARQIELATRF